MFVDMTSILEAAEKLKADLQEDFDIECTLEEARDALIASFLDMYPGE